MTRRSSGFALASPGFAEVERTDCHDDEERAADTFYGWPGDGADVHPSGMSARSSGRRG
jgi:hypothetical protein